MSPTLNSWRVSPPHFSVRLLGFHSRITNVEDCWVQSPLLRASRIHKCGLTSSSPASWVFGWRQARGPSRSRANGKRSCRLTPHLRERVPCLLLTRSWWTWAPPPRTHLHPGRRGDGGGGGGDGRHPGPPRHPAAPFLLVATAGSCWLRPHLIREENKFSEGDFSSQYW